MTWPIYGGDRLCSSAILDDNTGILSDRQSIVASQITEATSVLTGHNHDNNQVMMPQVIRNAKTLVMEDVR